MKQTLEGRKLLVTRSRKQVGEFSELLIQEGAEVIEIPTISISARPHHQLDPNIRSIQDFDWLIFTSVNGAEIFLSRAQDLNFGAASIKSNLPRICVIGPATARKVNAFGWNVDLVPKFYQAEGLLDAFLQLNLNQIEGLNILIPRASRARLYLSRELRLRGANVREIAVYDTMVPEESRKILEIELAKAAPDLITFTSSSTVRHLVDLAPNAEEIKLHPCAVIGPITGATARKYGFHVEVESKVSTIHGLFSAICSFYRGQKVQAKQKNN